jgi:hypothetical protein
VTNRDELGNSVLRSAARLTRWASRHASFDVPMAQARLLALVEELGPARTSALAAADHCSQPTMSTQLQRLEALSPAFHQLDAAALARLQVAVDALDDLLARASGDAAASTRHTRAP